MKTILLFLFLTFLTLTVVLWVRHGGGEPYVDLTTTPILGEQAVEEFLSYPEPIGNVAVDRTGRVFFSVHPEARPTGNKLLEFIDGAAVPFPDGASQKKLFDSVLGVAIDRFDRLWTIDHGNHGLRTPRLLAFDLTTGELIHDERFDEDVAPKGSFLQDLQVSPDGRTVVIADTSFWRKAPALIVYDIETATARRVLERHYSVSAENYLIYNEQKPMSFLGGIVSLRGGVDGIALGHDWLYYAALNGSSLYRVSLRDLRNTTIPNSQLAARIERYSSKPLSDGLSIDDDGNVFVTDVEHRAIFIVGADREARTLVRSQRLRWPDALSFGPDGWLYVADSALSDVVLKSRDHIDSAGPYRIYRFQPGTTGTPGQ
jgi:sugar lactone lactonase YvrE